MPSYATKELEKASLGDGSSGVVGKPTTKGISLIWSYGIHLKLWGDNLPLTGSRIGLIWTRRRETYITGRINEELGSFISTIIATILRENFRWTITQDNSIDEIDGFKISHPWQHVNHETWTQIIKNDIIPPLLIRKEELHSG